MFLDNGNIKSKDWGTDCIARAGEMAKLKGHREVGAGSEGMESPRRRGQLLWTLALL